MVKISKNNSFSFLLLLIVISVFSFIYQDIGVVLFPIFWLVVGSVILRMICKKDYRICFSIYLLSFSISIIYIYITNCLYVTDPSRTYFFNNDSVSNYRWVMSMISWDKYDGPHIFDMTHNWVKHGSGFFILSYYLIRIAQFIGSEYPLIVQMTQVSFFYGLFSVYVLKLLLLYFPPKKSYNNTVIFILLSPVFIYSAVYMRDLPIALFYLIGFYIMFKPLSVKNIIFLIILAFFSFLFRPTSGMLYLILPILYVLVSKININYYAGILLKIILSLILTPIILIVGLKVNTEQIASETLETYQEYTSERYAEADGLTTYVNRLPKPLQGPANFIMVNINPFPFTRGIHIVGETTKSETSVDRGRVQYLSFTRGIGILFWFLVLYKIVWGIVNKEFKKLESRLKYIFLISVFVLFVTSYASPEIRRGLGTLPVIFLVSLIFTQKAKLNLSRPIFIYIVLLFIYLFLKYF